MRKRKISRHRAITSVLVLPLLAGARLKMASAGQSDGPTHGVAVYVTDFELSVAPAAIPDPTPNTDKLQKHLQLRSHRLQDKFAETLVETFRKNGYASSRNEGLPGDGILLKGVFAESDQKNRIRRALLGSGSPATKLMLYVGAFDERSVSQPLYVEAPVQEPDSNYGPVITLNAYIPMAKYEIDKDIAEKDVRRICGQIAADLTTLLQRNSRLAAGYHDVHPLGRKMLVRRNDAFADRFAGQRYSLSEKVGQL